MIRHAVLICRQGRCNAWALRIGGRWMPGVTRQIPSVLVPDARVLAAGKLAIDCRAGGSILLATR